MDLKSTGNGIAKFAFYTLCLFIGGSIIATVFASNISTVPMVPDAQRVYDAAKYQECVAEVNLVNAKINDYANGLIELTNEDLTRLNEKRNNDCAF